MYILKNYKIVLLGRLFYLEVCRPNRLCKGNHRVYYIKLQEGFSGWPHKYYPHGHMLYIHFKNSDDIETYECNSVREAKRIFLNLLLNGEI